MLIGLLYECKCVLRVTVKMFQHIVYCLLLSYKSWTSASTICMCQKLHNNTQDYLQHHFMFISFQLLNKNDLWLIFWHVSELVTLTERLHIISKSLLHVSFNYILCSLSTLSGIILSLGIQDYIHVENQSTYNLES